jgi:hypothetical protein
MDLTLKTAEYVRQIAYHRLQADKYLKLFNSLNSQSFFIGSLLPSMSGTLAIDTFHPGDHGHDELKKFVEDLAQYHFARKLWLQEQHTFLCGCSTSSVPAA